MVDRRNFLSAGLMACVIAWPLAADAQAPELSYAGLVTEKIQRWAEMNPPSTVFGHKPASLRISIQINPLGELDQVNVTKSSGDRRLDDDVVAFVKHVAPFGRFETYGVRSTVIVAERVIDVSNDELNVTSASRRQ